MSTALELLLRGTRSNTWGRRSTARNGRRRRVCFRAAMGARLAGYADNTHPHHVRNGNWVREQRGIYRLAWFPLTARPDLMLWQLWAHNRRGEPQGTYSHNTALSLHSLSDVMPAKLEMTVPPGFQRMAAIPRVLRPHGGWA